MVLDMLNIGQFLCYQVQRAYHAHARDVYAASARRHATQDRSIKVVRFLHHDAIRNATGLMRKQATLTQRSSYRSILKNAYLEDSCLYHLISAPMTP